MKPRQAFAELSVVFISWGCYQQITAVDVVINIHCSFNSFVYPKCNPYTPIRFTP